MLEYRHQINTDKPQSFQSTRKSQAAIWNVHAAKVTMYVYMSEIAYRPRG